MASASVGPPSPRRQARQPSTGFSAATGRRGGVVRVGVQLARRAARSGRRCAASRRRRWPRRARTQTSVVIARRLLARVASSGSAREAAVGRDSRIGAIAWWSAVGGVGGVGAGASASGGSARRRRGLGRRARRREARRRCGSGGRGSGANGRGPATSVGGRRGGVRGTDLVGARTAAPTHAGSAVVGGVVDRRGGAACPRRLQAGRRGRRRRSGVGGPAAGRSRRRRRVGASRGGAAASARAPPGSAGVTARSSPVAGVRTCGAARGGS